MKSKPRLGHKDIFTDSQPISKPTSQQTSKDLVANKLTSPSTSTTTSTRRMTFWLEEGMIERIKRKAVEERRTASDILRKILEKNL